VEQRKTALVAFSFPEEKHDELLQACRDAGTTLQGAFVAAANFALAVVIQNPYLKTVCCTFSLTLLSFPFFCVLTPLRHFFIFSFF